MAFKLPNNIHSKRANSFHSKKNAPQQLSPSEESDPLYGRNKAMTPANTKSTRGMSFIDVGVTPTHYSKNGLHPQIYETPKSRQFENRPNIISESRNANLAGFFEKITANSKPAFIVNDEVRKLDEKHKQKIEQMTKEIERLKEKIQKLTRQKSSEARKEKSLVELKKTFENFKEAIEEFIQKTREGIEKICNFFISTSPISVINDINTMLYMFNENLETLIPYISHDAVIKNQFLVCENEALENTGRFKSLAETQNSFGVANNNVCLKEAIALADFKPNFYGELQFSVGDRIKLVKTDDPNWWLGKIGEKVGRIPAQLVMLD